MEGTPASFMENSAKMIYLIFEPFPYLILTLTLQFLPVNPLCQYFFSYLHPAQTTCWRNTWTIPTHYQPTKYVFSSTEITTKQCYEMRSALTLLFDIFCIIIPANTLYYLLYPCMIKLQCPEHDGEYKFSCIVAVYHYR